MAPLQTVRNGTLHRDVLRARDGKLPTMRTMRLWRQKVNRAEYPPLPCLFCGGPEEDPLHMPSMCERDPVVVAAVCAKVEEFTADLPLADRAMEYSSWKQQGSQWLVSLMAGWSPTA